MAGNVSVSLTRMGQITDLDLETPAFDVFHTDYGALPREYRSGIAQRFLGAALISCYAAALDHALGTRNAPYQAIEGKATIRTAREGGQTRIAGISLDVVVRLSEEYRPVFEMAVRLLHNGCMVSAAIDPAIPVECKLRMAPVTV